ncbi:hypothetical protein ZWY2020_009165 [Hordeum vulgare]|nr:hypothetical protein ZWY2020_009165 [Hordeum vulgare]
MVNLGSFLQTSTSGKQATTRNDQIAEVHIELVLTGNTTACSRLSHFVSNMSKPCDGPKTEWPELVGRTIEEAREKIKADRPDLTVNPVPVGDAVPLDFNKKRVWLWVDTVAEVPRIG